MNNDATKKYLKRVYNEKKDNGICVINGCNQPSSTTVCPKCKEKRKKTFKDSGASTIKITGENIAIIDSLREENSRAEFVNNMIQDLE